MCGAGRYSAGVGVNLDADSACIKCAAGKWNIQHGADSAEDCLLCPSGQYQHETGKYVW